MSEVYIGLQVLRGEAARPDRAAQSAGARDLLGRLLRDATGRAWRVTRDITGRPLIQGGPDVSLSHSGPMLAAAVATRGRIGIDVEASRPGRDRLGIAERWFSPAEQAVVRHGGEAALLACWTLREAFGKAEGRGVASALALDGRLVVGAVGGSATAEIDGCRWAFAQGGAGAFQVAAAWAQGDEAALSDALRAALAV